MQDDDGGVFHKQTSETFCGFVMPEEDPFTSVVIGTGQAPFKSSCATADFAAVMAIAARVYRPLRRRVRRHGPRTRPARPSRGSTRTLPCSSRTRRTSRRGRMAIATAATRSSWAAAELWRTTKEPRLRRGLCVAGPGTCCRRSADAGPPSWANVARAGLWTYVLGGGTGEALRRFGTASLVAADAIVARTNGRGLPARDAGDRLRVGLERRRRQLRPAAARRQRDASRTRVP